LHRKPVPPTVDADRAGGAPASSRRTCGGMAHGFDVVELSVNRQPWRDFSTAALVAAPLPPSW